MVLKGKQQLQNQKTLGPTTQLTLFRNNLKKSKISKKIVKIILNNFFAFQNLMMHTHMQNNGVCYGEYPKWVFLIMQR